MILQEYLEKLEPGTKVSLAYSNKWHTENGAKIYEAFFVGAAEDVPEEVKQETVEQNFIAFMWNTNTFILKAAAQKRK